jgi:ATP-dependent Clp protease protease subunit
MKNLITDFKHFSKDKCNISSLKMEDYINKGITANQAAPFILEERPMHATPLDIFSRMLYDRIIFFNGDVDMESCNIAIAQLLYLDSISNKDVSLYLNSCGGSCSDGLSLVDTMNFVKSDVSVINTGMALSMGAIILISGAKEKRFSLPHARVMIHQPSSGFGSGEKYTDMEIRLNEMAKIKKDLYDIIVQRTDIKSEEVETICEKNKWFSATEAKDLNFIDKIITTSAK